MDWVNLTKTICTTGVIAACAYDVLVLQIVGDKASISQWFHSYRNYPTAWLCLGWLMCHFIGVLESGPVAGKVSAVKPVMWHTFPFHLYLGISLALIAAAVVVGIRSWVK